MRSPDSAAAPLSTADGMARLVALAVADMADPRRGSPFVAMILSDGLVLGVGHNTVHADGDPTAHAEIQAIRAAAITLGHVRLTEGVLLSTCEPCLMCVGAAQLMGVARVVFGLSAATLARTRPGLAGAAVCGIADRGPLRFEQQEHPALRSLFEAWAAARGPK